MFRAAKSSPTEDKNDSKLVWHLSMMGKDSDWKYPDKFLIILIQFCPMHQICHVHTYINWMSHLLNGWGQNHTFWGGPHKFLASDSCTSVEWWIVWIRTKWQWQRDKKGSCQIPNNEILSPWKSVLSCLVNSSLVSEFSMRRSASGHFCFIRPSISLSQDFPPWPMLKFAIWK